MSLLPETLRGIADHLGRPREHVLAAWIAAGHPHATLDTRLDVAQHAEIVKLLMKSTAGSAPLVPAGPATAKTPPASASDTTRPAFPTPSLLGSTPDPAPTSTEAPHAESEPDETPKIDGDSSRLQAESDGLRQCVEDRLRLQEELRATRRKLASAEREIEELRRTRGTPSRDVPPVSQPDQSAAIRELKEIVETKERERRRLTRDLDSAKRESRAAEESLRSRESELADVTSDLAEARRRIRTLQRDNKALNAKLDCLKSRSVIDAAFPSALVHAWIANRRRSVELEVHEGVVLLGDGPLERTQLAALLKRVREPVAKPGSAYADVVVLGRDDFFLEDIEAQIRARSGDRLRIYSQEMFLASLLLNDDPFGSASKTTLKAFAEGHPGLELLLKFGFEWPSADSTVLGSSLFDKALETDESPPHRMGYVVGVTKGVGENERRRILASAFTGKIPSVGDGRYMKAWGTPGSPTRLRRMAAHLGWLIKTRRGLRHLQTARDEWTADLKWLHEEYYEDWMKFRWPASQVD